MSTPHKETKSKKRRLTISLLLEAHFKRMRILSRVIPKDEVAL